MNWKIVIEPETNPLYEGRSDLIRKDELLALADVKVSFDGDVAAARNTYWRVACSLLRACRSHRINEIDARGRERLWPMTDFLDKLIANLSEDRTINRRPTSRRVSASKSVPKNPHRREEAAAVR